MKKFRALSEAEEREWNAKIEELRNELLQQEVPLTEEHFLSEMQVCKLLGVSERTMRTYRKEGYFHYMKLKGRIIYFRLIFLCDIMYHLLRSGK